jgi:TolB-like protein/Tfp pilus assembly protein PilF
MIGRTLSHYEITGRLGAGGMGEVYLALDTKLERKVALKVLPPELADDPARLARLQREAKALAALDHPGIVTVFSVEESEGVHFLTMAYVEGETLGSLIPPGGMPVEQVLELGAALADALRAAHERGIVHRDLKPGNVMVDSEGRLRVLDFGLARVEDPVPLSSQMSTGTFEEPMTRQGMVLGTVPYMSPEQAEGKRVDSRSDLFSLGVVLYEMVTGSRPFRGDTAASLISSILRDNPPSVAELRPELPEGLDGVIQGCLEKEPAERFPGAGVVRDELEALRRDVVSGRVAWTAARRPAALRLGVVSLAVAAVVLAVVVGTMMWPSGARKGGAGRQTVGEAASEELRSVAVLPLRNLSGDPEQEYFVDGMTEALIIDLSKIASLKVIARSSAMQYKGSDAPLSEIAAAFGVDAVVEGSVIREGDAVGITAQLIEVATERVIWGEQYQRDLTSILGLQGELATAIAKGVGGALSPEEEALFSAAAEVDPAAYEAYLKGRFHWYRFTQEDMAAAKRYFEIALEIQPDYALALVGLADAITTPPHIGWVAHVDQFRRGTELIERALELDPDLAEAHDLRARYAFVWEWDWEGSERGFRWAIELNPNLPDARVVYSQVLGILGRHEEALDQAARGAALDPLNFFYRQQHYERLAWMGRVDEANAGYRELIESGGDLPFIRQALWDNLLVAGDYEMAYEEARRYYELMGQVDLLALIEREFEAGGYRNAMRAGAESLVSASSNSFVAAVDIAKLYAHAGDRDRTLEWLERSADVPETALVYVMADPVYEGLRGDPRFEAIRARMNLSRTE